MSIFVDSRNAITAADPDALFVKPSSIGENFAAARRDIRLIGRTDSAELRRRAAFQPLVDALNDGIDDAAKRFKNPFRFSLLREARDFFADERSNVEGIFEAIAARRKLDPQFLRDVPGDAEAFQQQINAETNAELDVLAATRARASVGGDIAAFAGAVVGGFSDPLNLATLPVGGAGGSIGRAVVIEGLLNAGVEAASLPFIASDRAELGRELTAGEAAVNVGAAFVGGAAFTGAVRGAAPAARAVARGATSGTRALAQAFDKTIVQPTRAQLAARIGLEREARAGETNPLPDTAAGAALHRERVDAAEQALAEDQPPPPVPALDRFGEVDEKPATLVDEIADPIIRAEIEKMRGELAEVLDRPPVRRPPTLLDEIVREIRKPGARADRMRINRREAIDQGVVHPDDLRKNPYLNQIFSRNGRGLDEWAEWASAKGFLRQEGDDFDSKLDVAEFVEVFQRDMDLRATGDGVFSPAQAGPAEVFRQAQARQAEADELLTLDDAAFFGRFEDRFERLVDARINELERPLSALEDAALGARRQEIDDGFDIPFDSDFRERAQTSTPARGDGSGGERAGGSAGDGAPAPGSRQGDAIDRPDVVAAAGRTPGQAEIPARAAPTADSARLNAEFDEPGGAATRSQVDLLEHEIEALIPELGDLAQDGFALAERVDGDEVVADVVTARALLARSDDDIRAADELEACL